MLAQPWPACPARYEVNGPDFMRRLTAVAADLPSEPTETTPTEAARATENAEANPNPFEHGFTKAEQELHDHISKSRTKVSTHGRGASGQAGPATANARACGKTRSQRPSEERAANPKNSPPPNRNNPDPGRAHWGIGRANTTREARLRCR